MGVTTAALMMLGMALREPAGDELRYIGRIAAVSAETRTIIFAADSEVDGNGREVVHGQPKTVQLAFSPWTVMRDGRTGRWLLPSEVQKAEAVAFTRSDSSDRIACYELWCSGARPAQLPPAPPIDLTPEPDSVSMTPVEVPMVFPAVGRIGLSDTFLASRGGGTRRHLGQDLMAPKMTPLVAPFGGIVTLRIPSDPGGHYYLSIKSLEGWRASMLHVNNDTPGTDDGLGGTRYAFAPGIRDGVQVYPGQLVGWVGDSGNAESTGAHLHFELWADTARAVLNAYSSLNKGVRLDKPIPRVLAPLAKPNPGEWRVEGEIRSIDPNRNVLVIDSITEWEAGKEPVTILMPQHRYIQLPENQVKIWTPRGLIPTNLSAVRPTDEVVAIGPKPAPGKGLVPTLCVVFKSPKGSL